MKHKKGISAETIDEYIRRSPREIQPLLRNIRSAIRKAAPEAGEKISYQIPTFTFHGNLVHFAGWKDHIGFYPTPSAISAFKKELSKYEPSKGTVKFPIDKPIPFSLIKKMVRFRMRETRERIERRIRKGKSG